MVATNTQRVVILCALFAGGCGAKKIPPPIIERVVETVEVKTPVLVQRVPPPELLARLQSPLPMFVPATDPQASSCLTPEGERLLRALIQDRLTRILGWETWAATSEDTPR